MEQFFEEVKLEREYQLSRGWKDEHNSAGAWVAYICNYVTRWAMPASFDPRKYNFGVCMVKAAALCLSAYEWWNSKQKETDAETVPYDVIP